MWPGTPNHGCARAGGGGLPITTDIAVDRADFPRTDGREGATFRGADEVNRRGNRVNVVSRRLRVRLQTFSVFR